MFRHVGIVVENLSTMKSFYCDFFNLEVLYQQTEKGKFLSEITNIHNAEADIIKLGKKGQIFLELLDYKSKKSSQNICLDSKGVTHFALTVDNSNDIFYKLSKNSYKCLSEPKISDNGLAKVFFCLDPEFNFIEIVEQL